MKRMILLAAAAISVGMLFGCNDEETKDTQELSAQVTVSEEITAETETETTTQAPPEVLPTYENADNFDNTLYGWYFMANGNHERPGMPNEHNIDFKKYYTYGMGSEDEKVIYLTFDEGYENGYTEQILNTLKEKNVPAAFFVTGYFLDQRPDLVKRMVDEGHIVGSHSVNHYSSPELSKEEFDSEILDLENSFKEKIGADMPHYFRPPRGEYSERTLALANNLGYKNIFWSYAHRDWLVDDQPDPTESTNNIVNSAHNGEILLLHAVSKTNSDILGDVIDKIRNEGYEFKSLDELK